MQELQVYTHAMRLIYLFGLFVYLFIVLLQVNNAAESAKFEEESLGLQSAAGDGGLYGGDSLRG
jgi:hypothetical protein